MREAGQVDAGSTGGERRRQHARVLPLVPHSGVQLAQVEVDAGELQFVYRRFLEEEVMLAGRRMRVLHALELDHTTMFHPVSGRPLSPEATTFMSGLQGLEPFLHAWMPVPFLRQAEPGDGTAKRCDAGPCNWVRAFVAPAPAHKHAAPGYTIVLAFDTAVATRAAADTRADTAPTVDDVAAGRVFALADEAEDVAAFLSEPWVDEWLQRQLGLYRAKAPVQAAALELEHVARYLTYLSVLRRACGKLQARFIDTLSQGRLVQHADADLVLDVGNSRTTGVLVEVQESQSDAAPKITPVELRDLSRPWLVHPSPVESRLEFNRPLFGDEALSRRSGRSGAFLWPSLVRIGREAVWLASRPSAREGTTGLSSAKRHFDDSETSEEAWRFVGAGSSGPVISGPVLAHLSERGELLRPETGALPAIRPRFSRSALFGLFVAELIVQALGMLNAPAAARESEHEPRPRRLRRVVLTMPFSATQEERETIAGRVRDAIDIVWQTSGWSEEGAGFLRKPSVEIGFDEAMSAQLVYLFNEVTQKLRASAAVYVASMGRSRTEHDSRPALRLASLDIGGGTSGLTIVTYASKDHQSVAPTLTCTARIRRGGDDALMAIISGMLSPALGSELEAKGLADASDFVHDALGVAAAGIEPDDRFARRFLAQYAQPIALVVLKDHERQRVGARHAVRHTTFGQLAARAEGLSAAVAAELEAHAAEMGARDFSLAATPLVIRPAAVAAAVRSALAPAVMELLDIVDAYDCDQVLLTGWVTRLPEVMDLALERLPDRPERIVPMHTYDVAGWYPFARSSGRIGDPKSTSVVGTLLGRRSAELLQGMQMKVADLSAQASRQLGAARTRKLEDLSKPRHRAGTPPGTREQRVAARIEGAPGGMHADGAPGPQRHARRNGGP